MRIISGEYKGRRFNNKMPNGVRPTMDATKEYIFNVIQNHADIDGAIVADLFAGSGSLGLEALSRGAKKVVFSDIKYNVLQFIQSCLDTLNVDSQRYQIHKISAEKSLEIAIEKFDIIFSDAPYPLKLSNKVLDWVKKYDSLSKGGLIILEHSREEVLILEENYKVISTKHFGDTVVTIVLF